MSLFVPVRDPVEVRRDLLSANKDVISMLRRYEHFHQIRKAKLDSVLQLYKEWQELAKLMRKLKTALPKTDIKAPSLPRMRARAKSVAKKTTQREHKSKLQLLEHQLSKIEGKLSALQ